MKRFVSLFLTACGASTPPPPPRAVHVSPVAVVIDAGPKCVEPSDEPAPKWVGTYPKRIPLFTMAMMAEKQTALVARNPDLEGFLFDERGFMYGFLTKKLPYPAEQTTTDFLSGRDVLADSRSIIEELRCRNPNIARFEPTRAWIGRSRNGESLIVERKHVLDDLAPDEPLPPPLDDDTLLSKWNVSVEVARVHKVVVHFPAQHCTPTPNEPCDPVGARDETIEKRVVVGTVPVPKSYLEVNVTRGTFRDATAFELRLVARVAVRWPELQANVVAPRFGASLEPQLAGNFQEVFDAVTGDPFNPHAQ
jgi:hypothetical protein